MNDAGANATSISMPPATTSPTLIVLPGWALGPQPLRPLIEALRQQLPDWHIECASYAGLTSHRPESWVAMLDRTLPTGAWLAGWSLGGMLATALAQWRGHAACGLVTLGTNASFVARPGWPTAMSGETFEAFRDGLATGPGRTLTRFAQLSAQGGRDARRLSRTLLEALQSTPLDHSLAGLAVLATLDLREALSTLRIPQFHLFAENDLLVPVAARAAIASRLPVGSRTACLPDAGHAFPLAHAEETAERMAAFLRVSKRPRALAP
ncbi:alpha/beta fold hydrolase [Salinicola avicenniae]|uniref:alpha/beta fold hydrolase n=1 Tax=Salinicola avicenniae TaxID=2916836 RepID=UPI00207460C4|nr:MULTISPECIES: alpha/beta fold hydrolase [unclassified Salinicola]